MNSSAPKKSSIQSLEEYYRLLDLYHDAYDRLQAGDAGSGYGGIHFEVMNELSSLPSIMVQSRQYISNPGLFDDPDISGGWG